MPETEAQPLKDLIPKAIQKLSEKGDSEKSPAPAKPKLDPIYLTPDQAKAELRKICLGVIYLNLDESKLRVKPQLEKVLITFGTNEPRGAIISGNFGCGKTTMLHYLAYRIFLDQPANSSGYTDNGKYIPLNVSPRFEIKMCRTSRLIHLMMEKNAEEVEKLLNSRVLMLDDFARHYSADYPLSKLEDFIEYRYANLKPTFVTLDVSLETMALKKEWSAMVDRFRDQKWMISDGALVIPGKSQRG